MAEQHAERIYTRVMMNLTRRHAEMLTFRRLLGFGLVAAAEPLKKENLELANAILNDSTYDEFFTDRKAAVEFFGGPETIAANTADQELLKILANSGDVGPDQTQHPNAFRRPRCLLGRDSCRPVSRGGNRGVLAPLKLIEDVHLGFGALPSHDISRAYANRDSAEVVSPVAGRCAN
jgi:hypothetical protein